jgi:hypothetical protein
MGRAFPGWAARRQVSEQAVSVGHIAARFLEKKENNREFLKI